jgi:minor extracellular serine protease Vpr
LDLKARVAANSGLQITLDFSAATAFPARTDVSSFSSRGPSVGSSLKPDLAAVGEEIVTGAQSVNSSGESYSPAGFIDTAGTSFAAPLAAGAAAVLKGARPGLTGQQYRSLLVNGAMPATVSDSVPATISQAGAGVLNLLAAVTGTVAAYPTALNFGTAPGTLHNTLQLSLSNVSTALDTFTLQAVAAGNAPVPSLATNSVVLDVGASQQVPVTLDASGLPPGEYSGYLQVSGTATSTIARIPYWFAVPGSDPAGISLLYQDFSDPVRSSSTQAVVLRIVDAAGLPYTGSVRPSVQLSGSGTVRSFYRTGSIPGTWAVDIRTGTADMQLSFTIGTVTQTVVIPVF